MLKCKRCGHRTRTINAMRKHYWKKHPEAMKRKRRTSRSSDDEVLTTIDGYEIVKRRKS